VFCGYAALAVTVVRTGDPSATGKHASMVLTTPLLIPKDLFDFSPASSPVHFGLRHWVSRTPIRNEVRENVA
jgi:hypothetical protein